MLHTGIEVRSYVTSNADSVTKGGLLTGASPIPTTSDPAGSVSPLSAPNGILQDVRGSSPAPVPVPSSSSIAPDQEPIKSRMIKPEKVSGKVSSETGAYQGGATEPAELKGSAQPKSASNTEETAVPPGHFIPVPNDPVASNLDNSKVVFH